MSKWPTVQDLASASLESVQQVWSGLGYYSRARRLREAAIFVVEQCEGRMPRTVEELLRLPGVGRYTASAVASIAYGQVAGLVDGNVVRVLSRVTRVGADSTSGHVTQHLWNTAEKLVEPDRPGDFNQAMMELGATVCSPKTPQCGKCPVQTLCSAFNNNVAPDIEDCDYCLAKTDFNPQLGVTNYPRKGKKTMSKDQETLVVMLRHSLVEDEARVMLTERRPETGLLANLVQFPSIELTPGQEVKEGEKMMMVKETLNSLGTVSWSGLSKCCDVKHVFSHINMTYSVYIATANKVLDMTSAWMTEEQFLKEGTSTAMKKVLKAVNTSESEAKQKQKADKCQKTLTSFFKVKSTK